MVGIRALVLGSIVSTAVGVKFERVGGEAGSMSFEDACANGGCTAVAPGVSPAMTQELVFHYKDYDSKEDVTKFAHFTQAIPGAFQGNQVEIAWSANGGTENAFLTYAGDAQGIKDHPNAKNLSADHPWIISWSEDKNSDQTVLPLDAVKFISNSLSGKAAEW